jgi:hypothetical protein
MNEKSLTAPYEQGFRVSVVASLVTLAGLLNVFVSPLLVAPAWIVIAPFIGLALIWLLLKQPTTVLGLFLAWMPFEFLVVMSGRFFGVPLIDAISKSKEPLLLLLVLVLWKRNGLRLAMPDWFLLGLFAIGGIHKLFGGVYYAFQDDFAFLLPYFAGRVSVLTAVQEQLWARIAVAIVAIVSAVGMLELFIIGEGPRTILYLALGNAAEVEEGGLSTSFHGTGYTGLREASTMLGPLSFGALCMVALIIWWAYRRNSLPAIAIIAGLICSVTRSAILGGALAICILAVALKQTKRLVVYAVLAITLLVAAIPALGLYDYLHYNQTGQDSSAEWHGETVLNGIRYIADHPLGTGPGSIGARALEVKSNALVIESSLLSFGGQYGISALLCLLGFLASAFILAWREHSPLGYAAAGIIVGFSVMMMVLILHADFRLNCWVWFPVGLAVRSYVAKRDSGLSGQQASA